MTHKLPELPYSYDALEPYIDAQTMEIHHSKHHQAYVNNYNNAIKGTELEGQDLEEVFKSIANQSAAIRNNGGGIFNHNFFWEIMGPSGSGSPKGKLLDDIKSTFGSFEAFKEAFGNAAVTRFGSGWAWLVVNNGKLVVTSTPNQDNTLMDVADVQGTPIIGLDVWEHAYYLKYQNRRPDYVSNFWNVINWDYVEGLYEK